jgi:hypothetical protein
MPLILFPAGQWRAAFAKRILLEISSYVTTRFEVEESRWLRSALIAKPHQRRLSLHDAGLR